VESAAVLEIDEMLVVGRMGASGFNSVICECCKNKDRTETAAYLGTTLLCKSESTRKGPWKGRQSALEGV